MAENSEKIDSCGDSSEQCHCYSALVGEQSIVMSMSVCLSASISQQSHVESLLHYLCMLPVVAALSSSGGSDVTFSYNGLNGMCRCRSSISTMLWTG